MRKLLIMLIVVAVLIFMWEEAHPTKTNYIKKEVKDDYSIQSPKQAWVEAQWKIKQLERAQRQKVQQEEAQRKAEQLAEWNKQEKLGLLDAWCIAQRFVEQRLKSPSTVKWPWVSYTKCTTYLGNGRYKCAFYCDAQNSFGAMVRTNFVCIVKNIDGENWRLESLTF